MPNVLYNAECAMCMSYFKTSENISTKFMKLFPKQNLIEHFYYFHCHKNILENVTRIVLSLNISRYIMKMLHNEVFKNSVRDPNFFKLNSKIYFV